MTMNNEIKLENSERQKCERWTRVMGYMRPFDNFNIGKKSEFKERKYFKESACCHRLNDNKNDKQDVA